jgi:exosortase/archaeosortase family protein
MTNKGSVLKVALSGVPGSFLAAVVLVMAFMAFLVADQEHWWRLRPEYAFGWLAPLFVVYLVADRWNLLREMLRAEGQRTLPSWLGWAVSIVAGLVLGLGLLFFLLGALCRAMAGATQSGSVFLAVGFAGIVLGVIYFNTPDGRIGPAGPGVWRALQGDAKLQVASLFLFPSLIWILTAPLLTAVENAVSLFLLNKVVAVVFFVFDFLGYPLAQQGNVLVLPLGRVGVADACSGIRSLTGCLFAGSFLAAMYLDRFWKKVTLVGVALCLAFALNLLRSLFLTAWAYAYGSDAIEGPLHDITGYAVLGLTSVALFGLLPAFSVANWRRWTGGSAGAEAGPGIV